MSSFVLKRLAFLQLLILFIPSFSSFCQKSIQQKEPNELIHETSSYLLEHAYNPIQWKPWSNQIFKEAKDQNKLVVISIGYSSCHWCHVMAEESFEDEEVAAVMNSNYINIKVDREERPDIDQLYMTAVQLIKGQGGWPLNVIVLPNGKPLYGGTYHTKNQWLKVLNQLNQLYSSNPEKANDFANKITQGIKDYNIIETDKDLDLTSIEELNNSVSDWKMKWDMQWGGDKGSEKFMLPENLNFLLDYGILNGDEEILIHVKNTLDKLSQGGIYDHVGGGFFRYSTDEFWKVPHFEKMLYDNAQLIGLYSKAYRYFKEESYKEVVSSTIQFLEHEMKDKNGAFYATIDADSDGMEGGYYIWTKTELENAIKIDFELFANYYNIKPNEVLENNRFVLFQKESTQEFLNTNVIDTKTFDKLKTKWLNGLKKVKLKKTYPKVDKKIITSWNALLISGYVEAYRSFGDQNYLATATGIMNYIKKELYNESFLNHSITQNVKNGQGFLEDYAFLIDASINLYTVSMNQDYLNFASKLTNSVNTSFKDDDTNLYKYSTNSFITNLIKTDDGVIPSPNSVMSLNLLKLGHILFEMDFLEQSEMMLKSIQNKLLSSPRNYAVWGSVLLKKLYPYYEIAIVGPKAKEFIDVMQIKYIPNTLIVGTNQNDKLPLFENRYVENETYIYVCQNSTCQLPVISPKEALKQLSP